MAERADLVATVRDAHVALAEFLAHDQSELILGSSLTMAQLKMLLLLRIYGPIGGNELARHLRVSMPSVTGMAGRLAARGLVERREDAADRRVRTVALSEQGAAMITDFEAAGREVGEDVLAELDDDDLRALAQGMHALQQVVGRRGEGGGVPVRGGSANTAE